MTVSYTYRRYPRKDPSQLLILGIILLRCCLQVYSIGAQTNVEGGIRSSSGVHPRVSYVSGYGYFFLLLQHAVEHRAEQSIWSLSLWGSLQINESHHIHHV